MNANRPSGTDCRAKFAGLEETPERGKESRRPSPSSFEEPALEPRREESERKRQGSLSVLRMFKDLVLPIQYSYRSCCVSIKSCQMRSWKS